MILSLQQEQELIDLLKHEDSRGIVREIKKVVIEILMSEVIEMDGQRKPLAKDISDPRIVKLAHGLGHAEFFLAHFNRAYCLLRENGIDSEDAELKAQYFALKEYEAQLEEQIGMDFVSEEFGVYCGADL